MPNETTPPILCPVRYPYDIDPCDSAEVAPLVAHLRDDAPVAADRATFPRGTVLSDGRLDLCKQSLGPGNCRLVTDALAGNTRIKSLLLGTDGIGDAGAGDVADLLGRNEHLEIVYLGCNRISEAGVARLCDALADNKTVTGLWLKRNPIGPEGARHVADLLRANRTLRTLDLVNTDIGPDGLAAVLDALIQENRTLERLYIGGNGIGPESAPRLAALLRANPTLGALLMNVNALGDAGILPIAEALRGENRTLRELGLASCGITREGGTVLFGALRDHPALLDLDLGYSPPTRVLGAQGNTLGDAGAFAAAEFLRRDPPLRRLCLRRNGIGPAGRARLSEAVESNTCLLNLELDGKEDPYIASALARNRQAAGVSTCDPHFAPSDVRLIKSVYRTAPTVNQGTTVLEK